MSMGDALLHFPEEVFSGEAEGFVAPGENGVVEEGVRSDVGRDVECPRQDFGNIGFPCQGYCTNNSRGDVFVTGGEKVITSFEG